MKRFKNILYNLLLATHKIKHRYYIYLNRFIFSINNVSYQTPLNINDGIIIRKDSDSTFIIGKNLLISSGGGNNALLSNIKTTIFIARKAMLKIGDNVQMSPRCIWAQSSITIGNNVKIGGDVILMDTDAHSLNYQDRRQYRSDVLGTNSLPIVIEDDVLIGARCTILKGVTIGARTIVGSGSVVTKSLPSDCIAGGNPCRIIKDNR